jgi:hypothetical protein
LVWEREREKRFFFICALVWEREMNVYNHIFLFMCDVVAAAAGVLLGRPLLL